MKRLYQFSFYFILLFSITASTLNSQRVITGIVASDAEGPLIGASVTILGSLSTGTITDIDGNYRINVPKDGGTLIFSYIGYATKEVNIGTENTINVILAEGKVLDEVVLVGSRSSSRTKLNSASPVDIIPIANVMSEVGQVDLNQILNYMAPSFQSARQTISDGTDHIDPAQLRGLGPDQVLVLINGKRRHQSALVNVNGTVNRGTVGTDLGAIPASSIDRIEILRDGAAAQYGSDAIAGVVNIVLKKSTGRISGMVSGGTYVTSYAKNYALNWASGADPNVNVTDGTTIQATLNYGLNIGRKGYLNLTGEYISRGATNRTGTYTGQIYPRNASNQIVDNEIMASKGLTREDFDMRIGNSEISGGGLMLNLGYELSKSWDLYAFGGINSKKGNATGFFRYPSTIVSNARIYANDVLKIYPDGFLPAINSDVTDIAATVGVKGKWSMWNVDFSNTLGQNTFNFTIDNSVNFTQAAVSPNNLQTSFDAGGNSFLQNSTNIDFSRKFKTFLDGTNIAFGVENRIDQYGITAGEEASYLNYNVPSAAAAGAQVFAGFLPSNEGKNGRNSQGVYVDVEQDFTKAFMMAGALRFENYSDFGSTLNWKLASRLELTDGYAIRGSVSTGFRAPSMQQRFYAKTNTLFVTTPAGLVPVESGTFTNDSAPAKILGIPELKQETSVNYSLGLTGRISDNLDFTIDAYQIDITNRIVLTNNFTDGGNAALKAQLDAVNAGQANFFTNAIDTRSQGLEAVLSYNKDIGDNQNLRIVIAGAFINNSVKKDKEGNAIIKASPTLEATGQIGRYFNREDQSRIEVANPNHKISTTVNYKIDKISFMIRGVSFGEVTYLDPTINPNNSAIWPVNVFKHGSRTTLDQTFAGKTIFDASVSYDFSKEIKVTLGANNLFDTYQDIHEHSGNMGLGRFVYSRRVQQFGFNGRYTFARVSFNF